jgi:SHS2 domain-containing protein
MCAENSNSESQLPPYEEVEHTADIALRVRGKNLNAFLVHAARGMCELYGVPDEDAPLSAPYQVKLESPDLETLLVDWLNELLYLMEIHELILTRFIFQDTSKTHLIAQVKGRKRRRIDNLIKATTFHNLEVEETSMGYEATIVFDV